MKLEPLPACQPAKYVYNQLQDRHQQLIQLQASMAWKKLVVLLVALAAVVAALPQQQAVRAAGQPPASPDDVHELRVPGVRRRRRGSRRGSPALPPPAAPLFPPTTPSSPAAGGTTLPPCNRSVVPPMMGPGADQSASPDNCLPTPRPAPAPPAPHGVVHYPPCVCPKPHPGLPLPGAGGSTSSSPTECVAPLAALMTCGAFLTGSEEQAPRPQSECCDGLGAFLNSASAAAAAGGGDRLLRCLCPVILGDVNRALPKPIDPVRLLYLPIACGVVLPPQVLYICFSESSFSISSISVAPIHYYFIQDLFYMAMILSCWMLILAMNNVAGLQTLPHP
jgi:hypothetical protein